MSLENNQQRRETGRDKPAGLADEGPILITRAVVDRIKELAEKDSHIEICGYLAGTGGTIREIFPMTNADDSAEHYAFLPEEQFQALEKAAGLNLELSAVYHSHLASAARMSAEDIRLAYDTSISYLIYSLLTEKLRAYRVGQGQAVTEVPLEVIP